MTARATPPSKAPPKGRRAAAWVGVATAAGTLVATSPTLMGFLHQWEDGGKDIRTVYADKLAGGLPTTCGGLTNHTSRKPVVVGETWTEEECAIEKNYVVGTGQERLIECFEVKPPQSVFDAFSSHAHNFGNGTTCASQALAAWNRGDPQRACELLAYTPDGKPNWASVRIGTKPDGRPELRFVQGLHNRRVAEMKLCRRDLP